ASITIVRAPRSRLSIVFIAIHHPFLFLLCFLHVPSPPESYTLSLHDALPISLTPPQAAINCPPGQRRSGRHRLGTWARPVAGAALVVVGPGHYLGYAEPVGVMVMRGAAGLGQQAA